MLVVGVDGVAMILAEEESPMRVDRCHEGVSPRVILCGSLGALYAILLHILFEVGEVAGCW